MSEGQRQRKREKEKIPGGAERGREGVRKGRILTQSWDTSPPDVGLKLTNGEITT